MRDTFAATTIALVLCFAGGCDHHDAPAAADSAAPKTPATGAGPVDTAKATDPEEPPGAEPSHGKSYETIFYPSGSLKIEGYVYRPEGPGPFPAIIYSHGSRKGHERKEVPFAYVGEMLRDHGYVVLVAERRGYGKSEGEPFTEAEEEGEKIVPRMQDEAGDVLAGYDYLATLPYVDKKSVGLMGWSLGGIATIFALSRSTNLRAGVNQAGASLSWKHGAALRSALPEAAAKIQVPLLSMDAKNDATNESVTAVDDAMAKGHAAHKLVIYPPFEPSHESKTPHGHLIFTAEGMPHWKDEVVAWFDLYVKSKPTK